MSVLVDIAKKYQISQNIHISASLVSVLSFVVCCCKKCEELSGLKEVGRGGTYNDGQEFPVGQVCGNVVGFGPERLPVPVARLLQPIQPHVGLSC